MATHVNLPGEGVTRAEYEALEQRLEAVEAALGAARSAQVESIAEEALAKVEMTPGQKASLIESVVQTIQTREEKTSYPWMQAEKWARIKKGMTPEAVVEILGTPLLNEPSLHKRVDAVYTYQGRRVATNEKVTGIIRFYKGVVIEMEVPKL
ncbi:MAG: outer membrane protein assembly factor BamE [Verrucomicrobia bacterium]|nr:outer membrane protein assembly factor BamE [Verrucomicrobiota bacterium]